MPKRAKQLPAASIGLLPWQQKVWLLQIEHVLAGRKGPPDLLTLEGFGASALTQYTVTTPDLLRSFRRYNAGKPYHRQVRPFGFMVMFQQLDEGEPSTVMRVMAPFNRNPMKAVRKAFDRDTGASVTRKKLKTYAKSLEHYHNHPESKFLNGARGDRGPTQRRHIIARSIILIGKEANKLESQQVTGIDPQAQVEFHVDASRVARMKALAAGVKQIGPTRLARETGLSRKHISAVAAGYPASHACLSAIERAISRLEVLDTGLAIQRDGAVTYLAAECKQFGLRAVATRFRVSPGLLSRILSGQRALSETLAKRITAAMPGAAL